MTELHVKAHAKLNFGLDVTGTLADGYHSISTVMQSISLCDDITLRLGGEGKITARTNLRYIPDGDRNIAVRAAKLFFEETGIPLPGGTIEIKKRIPVCAGMGGGSSDGAAVLRALNAGFHTRIDRKTLERMALSLGSDVPFCVSGGTSLCTGKGEIMTALPALSGCYIVVCKPPFPISTPELFKAIDNVKIKNRPDMGAIVKAVGKKDLQDLACHIYNVFEDVLPPRCAEIRTIKSKLIDLGALGSSMTGTGSAVFGLFPNEKAARHAWQALKPMYRDCFIARTTGKINV